MTTASQAGTSIPRLGERPDDALEVVGPGMSRVALEPRARECTAFAEIERVQREGVARYAAGGDRHAAVDGGRQDEALVVVGVLADQVHPPGGERRDLRVVAGGRRGRRPDSVARSITSASVQMGEGYSPRPTISRSVCITVACPRGCVTPNQAIGGRQDAHPRRLLAEELADDDREQALRGSAARGPAPRGTGSGDSSSWSNTAGVKPQMFIETTSPPVSA